jgi:predicted nucleotidyltransferase
VDEDGQAAEQALDMSLRNALRVPSFGVISAYVFGSHATGRVHAESDIDVGVLLDRHQAPTGRQRFESRVHISSELIRQLRHNEIDVVVLNDAPPQFARRIVTAGRRVYCRDEAADHAFVRDVQLRAADLEPFLRRTRRIKLTAMAR